MLLDYWLIVNWRNYPSITHDEWTDCLTTPNKKIKDAFHLIMMADIFFSFFKRRSIFICPLSLIHWLINSLTLLTQGVTSSVSYASRSTRTSEHLVCAYRQNLISRLPFFAPAESFFVECILIITLLRWNYINIISNVSHFSFTECTVS